MYGSQGKNEHARGIRLYRRNGELIGVGLVLQSRDSQVACAISYLTKPPVCSIRIASKQEKKRVEVSQVLENRRRRT